MGIASHPVQISEATSKNLFDAEYRTTISPGGGNTGALTATLGDPQMYILPLRFRQ